MFTVHLTEAELDLIINGLEALRDDYVADNIEDDEMDRRLKSLIDKFSNAKKG